MKRILAVVGLLLCMAGCVGAQNFSGASSGDIFVLPPHRACFGADDSGSACLRQNGVGILRLDGKLDFIFVPKLVAALPAAASNAGRIYRVTDGSSSSDCSSGSGSTSVLCISDGNTWSSIGSGGGGSGTVTVKSAGALADTAFVTGGGTTVSQTPSATSTLSSSGNAVFAGTVTTTGLIVPQAGGVGNQFNLAEGTAPATDPAGNTFGGTGFDGCYADSTSHGTKCKFNGESTALSNTRTVASGTSAMGTSAISSGACATVVTTTATGTATTDVITATPNADPTGVTGYAVSATGSLYIVAYPTANNVNFKVCNNTSGSLTPSALTLNWRVSR